MALINTNLLNRFWTNGILPIKKTASELKTKVDQVDKTLVAWRSEVDTLSTNVDALKKSVSDGKKTVANAITGQGVSTAADASFGTMAGNITTAGNGRYNAGYGAGKTDGINATKKGNASPGNVLQGITFTSTNGVNLTGTLINRGQFQYAGGVGSGFDGLEDDPESEYIAFNKIPEGAYFSNGADWAPEIRIRRSVLESFIGWDQHYEAGYNAGYNAGSSAHQLVDLPVGVTIQHYPESGNTIVQSLNLSLYKQLGYRTVEWNNGGGDYVVAVKENNSSGDSVYNKGYHTSNGSDHSLNLKDGGCPGTLYIYADTSGRYSSTKTFTFKA